MNKNKNCLILLATYNGERYIKEQIQSLLYQENVNLRIIVSDDLSTDSTLEIVSSFDDNRIEVLPNIGKFGSASQNFFRLVREANLESYDFVAFADQDDIWYSNKIYNAINILERSNKDAYSSNVLAFWENGKTLTIKKAHSQKSYDFLFSSPGPGCTYVFKSKLAIDFKRQLTNKPDITSQIDLHDWLIYAYARSKEYTWYIDDNVSMKYRQHESNEFGANAGLKAFKNRWHRCRNGWYRQQILYTAEFCDINNHHIRLLKKNDYSGRLLLLKDLFKYRRSFKEALFLGFALVIPGFK